MLRTSAPLIGALDVGYESLRSLSAPKFTNRLQARHHLAAFEVGFALHFIGARRDDRVGLDKKNKVSWSSESQSRTFYKNGQARLSLVIHFVRCLGAPDFERSAAHRSNLDQWRACETDVGGSGKARLSCFWL